MTIAIINNTDQPLSYESAPSVQIPPRDPKGGPYTPVKIIDLTEQINFAADPKAWGDLQSGIIDLHDGSAACSGHSAIEYLKFHTHISLLRRIAGL